MDIYLILENQIVLMEWASAGEPTNSPHRRDLLKQITKTRQRLESWDPDAPPRFFSEIPI